MATVTHLTHSNAYSAIEQHILRKEANHEWLTKVLEGEAGAFPYRPLMDGEARIEKTDYKPIDPCEVFPCPGQQSDPIYHVTIPLAHVPGVKNDDQLFTLLKIFQEEAFGKNAGESAIELKKRFSLVIGINQIRSVDEELNRSFITFVQTLQKVNTFANRIFGFFWVVKWTYPAPSVYPLETAFTLVKVFNSELARKVQISLEMLDGGLHPAIKSQIPFQRIRERIKDSEASLILMSHILTHAAHDAPIYFGVMDADCKAMRTDLGLFSRMDAVIKSRFAPSAISLGYSVANDERPLIRLGVKLDMAVRAAMNDVIPFSAYFPEPGSFFRLYAPGKKDCILLSLSFIGDGRALENRRLIQNAVKCGFLEDSAVFIADGGVTIATPSRMRTLKNERVTVLSAAIVKQKQYLEALREISQTHAFPKEWADNLYIGLGLKGFKSPRVTDATQHFMHLLGVYDPITRMYTETGRYSSKTFDKIMRVYHAPLPDGLLNTRNTIFAQLSQLKMPKELIDKVDLAAQKSGEAIFQVLDRASHS